MLIDLHVHLIAMNEANGCYVSPKLSTGMMYFMLSRVLKLQNVERERIDEAYRDKLIEWVTDSDLDAIGMLAFDAVYDQNGEYDKARTHLYVSNDYCLDVCSQSDRLIPICSVNPQRKDAIAELERVTRAGSAAIKLLPNTQGFDPSNDAYRPFWRRMGELGIPLLSHTSFEHALPVIDQRFGKPELLRPALEEGATVIAAHCAGGGVLHLLKDDIQTWLAMLAEYPKLYGDISAMASMARFPYIHTVLKHELARERILLGSDFPIPVSPLVFVPQLGFARAMALRRIENPLQRNLETFRALGVDQTMLDRSATILKL
ncbi:MAG: amidohydrolase [Bradymonadaceae bacterium]|nr:amidohydrolase [Lujinxingiaceae bacterium]